MASGEIRISKIAGRYLVFDPDHVAVLRREQNICSVLTGTTPQSQSQNVYLGLPLELLPEEADGLISSRAAYIADEAADHLHALRSSNVEDRRRYLALIQRHRSSALQKLNDELSAKAKKSQGRAAKSRAAKATAATGEDGGREGEDLFSSASRGEDAKSKARAQEERHIKRVMITPTTSRDLVFSDTVRGPSLSRPGQSALYHHLHSLGYFVTPGLRFGALWSVYPGDPLRYHAHFLAHEFGWDETIDMLDLVTRARLGTAVKKSYLIGGKVEQESEDGEESPLARAFCIEWAGM